MRYDMDHPDLRNAFTPMPGNCRDALMTAARSVKEEEPVKRITFRAILITACIILATMAIAIAATKTLGWTDFFEIFYGQTGAVTDEAQKIMDSTEEQTFVIGPVSFTVQSLFADMNEAMATTLITTADGSRALFCLDLDSVGSNGENGEALARKLGVDPESTWIEAARQLNCPLYRVGATIHNPDPYDYGGGMMDALYDENSSLIFFSTVEIVTPGRHDPAPMELWFHADQIDLETGNEIELGYAHEPVQVPMSLPEASVTYRIPEDYMAFGLRLDSVRAEHAAAGLYLHMDLTFTGGPGDPFGQIWPVWMDENGQEYPEGVSMGCEVDRDQWPQVSISCMISADSVPEKLRMRLIDDNDESTWTGPFVTLELDR